MRLHLQHYLRSYIQIVFHYPRTLLAKARRKVCFKMDFRSTSSINLSFTINFLLLTSFVLNGESVPTYYRAAGSPASSDELQKCASGLGAACGDSIYHQVFGVGKGVSKECCRRLLAVGEDCHDLLTDVSIVYEHHTEEQAKEIRLKNDKVWEDCKNNEVAPSPSTSDELQKCASGLGATCGDSIYQNIFGAGKQISKECCGRLLTVGEDCHDLLTGVTIVYKRLSEKHAREVRHKNDEVWKQCKNM